MNAKRSVPEHGSDNPTKLMIPVWVPRTVAEEAEVMLAHIRPLAGHMPVMVRFVGLYVIRECGQSGENC